MTVKEAILAAAIELGIDSEVERYMLGSDDEGKEKVELLLKCFQIVENELALDYIPLKAEDEIYSVTGNIAFDVLSRSAVRIIGITDSSGNDTTFKLYADHLITQTGKVKITYTYTPEKKTLDEESDFKLDVSPRLMGYGIAVEYALICGMFEEAAVWDRKYKEAIEAVYKARPAKRMSSRRWA